MTKEKNRFYLTCNCGCGETIMFMCDFGKIYIAFLQSQFYAYQPLSRLNIILKAFKDKPLTDIVCAGEDLERLREWLSNVIPSLETDEIPEENVSHIEFEKCILPDDEHTYFVYLYRDQKGIGKIADGIHRSFDIVLDRKESERFYDDLKAKIGSKA